MALSRVTIIKSFKAFIDLPRDKHRLRINTTFTNICVYTLKKKKKIQTLSCESVSHTPGRILRIRVRPWPSLLRTEEMVHRLS